MFENINKNEYVNVTFKDEYINNERRINKDYISKNGFFKVVRVNEGLNVFEGYGFNGVGGKPQYKYYTKEYLFNNNLIKYYDDNRNLVVNSITLEINKDIKMEFGESKIENISTSWKNKRIINAINKTFDYCNLNTEDDDIIYKSIYKNKLLASLSEDQINEIYEEIKSKLGY